MSEPDKSMKKSKRKVQEERSSDISNSLSTVAPQHSAIESSTKASDRSGVPSSSTKRVMRADSNESTARIKSTGNIVDSILSDAESNFSDSDHITLREILVSEAQSILKPGNRVWELPQSHVAVVESFEILKASMKKHPGNNNPLWFQVQRGIMFAVHHLAWIQEISEREDLLSHLHPKRTVRSYLSREPDPMWIYLPYVMHSLSEDLSFAFKSRVTLKYLCESFRNFLLEYDESDLEWEIDTTGEQLLKRASEFMKERGMNIILPLQNSTEDDRILSNSPPAPISALEVQQPTISAGSTTHSGTTFHHTPSILRNLKEVKLDSLTKTQIDAFKENIRQNRIQHPGYTFSRDLLPQSTQYQLNNLWNLYEQALGKESNKINDGEWKTISEVQFYSFLDTLSDSNFIIYKRKTRLSTTSINDLRWD